MARAKAQTPEVHASTADLLRALIAASGMTDYALSKASGVTQSQIGRFKKGERSLTVDVADKLFRGLGYEWPPPTEVLPPKVESG